MALTSPGVSITVNDQSQYINSAVGSVPLVLLATAQDKKYNGVTATGTTKTKAGSLLSFSSQRDLVTQMGVPKFQLSSAGSPVHGSEINEYGLMTAYSALGLGNQCYAIRADVDLNQLVGTTVRPNSPPMDQTYWFNLVGSELGIYVLNAATKEFTHVSPLKITDATQVVADGNNISTPSASVGQVGQYALVFVEPDGTAPMAIRLFLKGSSNSYAGPATTFNNQWVEVGSTNWQNCVPTLTGTAVNPAFSIGSTFTINGVYTIQTTGTTVAQLAADINNGGGAGSIPGVRAVVSTTNQLMIFVTSLSASTGGTADGKISIVDGTNSPMYTAGIVTGATSGTKAGYCPYLFYGNYAQAPANGWFSTDTQPRPTGSIWWKTSTTGTGFSAVLSQYSATQDTWTKLSVPLYVSVADAIYSLDPLGGGTTVKAGQVIATYMPEDNEANGIKFYKKDTTGLASATGASSPVSGRSFVANQTYTISYSIPGSNTLSTPVTITTSGTTGQTFVQDILSMNLPYVTASYNASTSQITITHTSGGIIHLLDTTAGPNNPLATAGFNSDSAIGVRVNNVTGVIEISNFSDITDMVEYNSSTPYTSPDSGTYWYFSNSADIDIMIQSGTGWVGYQSGITDVRGNNLGATDPLGVIVSTNKPISQTDGSPLVGGDIWLDSSDLANYPSLYRYHKPSGQAGTWTAIDNTDHTTSNGILFADARWDTTGTTDIITESLPSITSLLTSNYIDQDAPDYRLHPRGMLLFNTRRSGYNVKKFVPNYFNADSFPAPASGTATVPGAATSLPTVTDAWVSASGTNSNGVMNSGSAAQRAIITTAMQAAINSNLSVLEPIYQFNLICAPNYPELIPAMITLNDNRGDTAFIIGDMPMKLTPNEVAISRYVNNVDGTGLPSDASATPYLALYYPSGLTTDLAGNTVVVPASHAVLRTFLYNDQVAYPWFAPAGTHRGLISNLSDIGYISSTNGQFIHNGISQGLRDALYKLHINPLTQLPGTGLVVWGQVTRSGTTTSRDRINVVRLENYLRTLFNSVANGYLFEPNDTVTRKSIANQIEHSLNNVLSLRGLYDYLVICDSSNNTADTVANNRLYVDVAIEPMRDVEFIYIPIAIYNPGDIAALRNTQ